MDVASAGIGLGQGEQPAVLLHVAGTPSCTSTQGIVPLTFAAAACGITQVQLGDALGVSQQTVQAHEVWRWRLPVTTLRLLAKTLLCRSMR